MDPTIASDLSYPIGLGIAAAGSGIGLGIAVSAALQAISRQPESSTKIQTVMIMGCAFIESITIYVLISIFLLK